MNTRATNRTKSMIVIVGCRDRTNSFNAKNNCVFEMW